MYVYATKPCKGLLSRTSRVFQGDSTHSPPSHPTPILHPPSKMSGPSPSPDPQQLLRTPCLIALLFTCGVSISVPCLTFCYNIFNDRKVAKEVRRSARAEEMKALMARLDRFYAKSRSGDVMGRDEIEEGKRMERLFRRWLRSLGDNAVGDDEGRSLVVTFEKWPGWI